MINLSIYPYYSHMIRSAGPRLIDRINSTFRVSIDLVIFVPVNLTWSGTSDHVSILYYKYPQILINASEIDQIW